MNIGRRRALRAIGAGLWTGAGALGLSGCAALPRSGPLASQLDPDEEDGALEGLVARVTPAVAAQLERPPARRFPEAFLEAPAIDPETLGPGDEIDVLVWEPGGGGVFGPPISATEADGAQTGAAALQSVRIGASGEVFVPFVGAVRAAGLTPGALRGRIRDRLAPLSAAAEVDVRVSSADSRSVTVQGAVNRPGVYFLKRGFTRLTPLLALAGGSPGLPEQVEVAVRRGQAAGAEMLEDVYADPALDIALRPGDVIVLNPIRERFVALGASTAQAEIVFPTRELSALSALGAAAGLRDFDADPRGVFVLRLEDRELADALLPGPPAEGLADRDRRAIIYRLDLTSAEGLFAARAFQMRDGDLMVSTNAPLTELRKFVQIFTSVLTPVQQSFGVATVAP
ncbi:polysaccharide biosynthesis/export family protein [Rubrimonas sp.]|uniref:polysaccharide biosynthesis/export family protein n=1 Tax=Rubrimonas sp. TaxID=2036015 RepID=UPI002FDD7B87